jgi:hypothetical protein
MVKIFCSSVIKNQNDTYNKLKIIQNMKVVKAEEVVLESPSTEPQVDQKRIAEAQENFDRTRQIVETKSYSVALDSKQTSFLMDNFFSNVSWKGYESYAIAETYKHLEEITVDGQINGKAKVEIIEAIFHFLKNHIGTGVKDADLFRQVCDQFALPMKEINEDRQELRDLSLELIAAEQGISVEKAMEEIQKNQGLQAR